MSEKPNEDILITPEWSILEFGDGYIAMVCGVVQKSEGGEVFLEVTIEPSLLLRKRYNIKDSELNANNQMKIKIKKNDVIILNPYDDANRKWLYTKTFKNEETELSNYNFILLKRLSEADKKIEMLQGEIIWYSEQLALAKSNPAEFISQGAEVFSKIFNNMSDAMRMKQEKPE